MDLGYTEVADAATGHALNFRIRRISGAIRPERYFDFLHPADSSVPGHRRQQFPYSDESPSGAHKLEPGDKFDDRYQLGSKLSDGGRMRCVKRGTRGLTGMLP
jgi:hypothetical protein